MLRNAYRSYLVIAGLTFLTLAALSIALCVYVDPYRMYGTGRIEAKPRVYNQQALAKSYLIERVRPNTLILGNGTVEAGIDPLSAEWPQSSQPVFNAAGHGFDVFLAWRFLQHDLAVKPPQLVVLGLDFADFVSPQATADTIPLRDDEKRLLVDRAGKPNPARGLQLWRDFFNTTLTRQSILDSIATLKLRNRPETPTMTELGFNPALDYSSVLHQLGQEAIFSRNDGIYRKQFRNSNLSYFYSPMDNVELRALSAIVKLAEENDIRLVLFVPPYHSRYLEILHETGFWASFESWKRALVRTVDTAAGKRRNLVLLYDFSDYDDISGEHVPPPGNTQAEMRWYRDSKHYTRALGDLMIASLLNGGPVLGEELKADTLEAHLAHIRKDRDRLFAPLEARFIPIR